MPKNRRAQVVNLTQTAKKTRDHKSTYISEVREAIGKHDTLYLFSYENMRSNKFKNVRLHFRDGDENNSSRIFLGKNKLLQIALGRTPEEEFGDNLCQVAKRITGSVGLLLTSRDAEEVEEYFASLQEEDFARAGSVATTRVVITNEMVSAYPVSMMEHFRKLGLPVEIQTGKIVLVGGDYVLCKEGATLSAENCKVLVHFGIKLSEFKVQLVCRWKNDGDFTELD
ncbi:mRNA turnover protein [Fragilaria crotonensis]|nr:mRNA turnover protein [Fragilaria crotonensis]